MRKKWDLKKAQTAAYDYVRGTAFTPHDERGARPKGHIVGRIRVIQQLRRHGK